jgi:aminocarboxymuconate-semialdehyde decarboxylase
MATLIDWHAHHTPPELVDRFVALGEKPPRIDPEDDAEFERRIDDMDAAGIDVQLVSPGAGVTGDRFPAETAIELARLANEVIADRIAPYPGRLLGNIAITMKDPDGSIQEIERMAARGFRSVLFFAKPEAVGLPETESVLGKAAELGLPIFLHGGGGGGHKDATLDRLEDGGQGVTVSVGADASVADFCVRLIAAGTFDRYPSLQIVIRSSGGSVPMLLNKLYWKHRSPDGEERRYSQILLEHFLVDCASSTPKKLQFLSDTMGEDRVVFGSDYCGGSGPLTNAVRVVRDHANPTPVVEAMERTSRQLLKL